MDTVKSEAELRRGIVKAFRRLKILIHADLSGDLLRGGNTKNRAMVLSRAQLDGMCKGWPDLCIIYKRVYFFELKTGDNKVMNEQKLIHGVMDDNGVSVYVIRHNSVKEAIDDMLGLICYDGAVDWGVLL